MLALRDLRALTRIALGSNSLGAVRASAVNDYKSCVQDGRSVREWLGTIGLVGPLRESAETLIGQTFGGANLDEISLLSFAELVGGEGKGLLFLLDGFGLTDYVVEGMGALCAWLADQLASVRLESAVVSVEQDANGVAVQTISGEVIEGDRVIVTVPATILDLISFSPQLPNAIRDANSAVQYGQATKIAAVVNRRGILRTTGFVGGSLVRQGWSAGDVLYGLTGPDGAASDLPALVEDLCDGFRVDPQDVAHVELVGWAHDPFCLGTYGHFLPGRFDGFRRSLPHYAGRVYVAGSERSTRPGFMEGAVESGEAAADAILRSA